MSEPGAHESLRREVGVFGASVMGLGAMVGTGIFVGIGLAAGAAGSGVIFAIIIAALVATCNALSSAQLAATHPVSGGTYEYGYVYLRPWLGFTAGWMFLCAKSASAATAALGFSGYLLQLLGFGAAAIVPVAFAATVTLTVLVLSGLKRSNRLNIAIVGVTLAALALFVIGGLANIARIGTDNLLPLPPTSDGLSGFLYATALMFVAYTGYARIATLGEEIKNPRRSIPVAIIITLATVALLYIGVAVAALGTVNADEFADAATGEATPLEFAAGAMDVPWLPAALAIGAITAMLGVLLNLLLGLSRVLLALGRRGDAPPLFARLNRERTTPSAAVAGVGVAIVALTLTGSVETTWAFSAFTVLVYYAITNLAALRLPPEHRLYSRLIPITGLVACVFLAFWVPAHIWGTGLALIGGGLIWHFLAQRHLWRANQEGRGQGA